MELGSAADAVDEPIAIIAFGIMKDYGTSRAIFLESFDDSRNP